MDKPTKKDPFRPGSQNARFLELLRLHSTIGVTAWMVRDWCLAAHSRANDLRDAGFSVTCEREPAVRHDGKRRDIYVYRLIEDDNA